MLAPIEMRRALPMTLHGSGVTMTTEVWSMLVASEAGDLELVARLVAHRPELRTCQFHYTSPLHLAVREGHVALVKELVAAGAFDPAYKSYPFGDDLLTMARDREYDEIAGILEDAAHDPEAREDVERDRQHRLSTRYRASALRSCAAREPAA